MKRVLPLLLFFFLALRGHGKIEAMLQNPLQPPDTSSPEATLYGFISDMNLAFQHSLDQGRANLPREHTQIHECPVV